MWIHTCVVIYKSCSHSIGAIQRLLLQAGLAIYPIQFHQPSTMFQSNIFCLASIILPGKGPLHLTILAKIGSSGSMVGLVKAVDFGHLGLCSAELHPSFKDTGL